MADLRFSQTVILTPLDHAPTDGANEMLPDNNAVTHFDHDNDALQQDQQRRRRGIRD